MKLRFLTLSLLALALNCHAAEYKAKKYTFANVTEVYPKYKRYFLTHLSPKTLFSNTDFIRLQETIHRLKPNIKDKSEQLEIWEKLNGSMGEQQYNHRLAKLKQDIICAKAELTIAKIEQKRLLFKLDPHCKSQMLLESL